MQRSHKSTPAYYAQGCDKSKFRMIRDGFIFVLPPQSSMESPNLEFEYGDSDTLTAELSGKD